LKISEKSQQKLRN